VVVFVRASGFKAAESFYGYEYFLGGDLMRSAVIVFGAPGSGKGTQCSLLTKAYDFEHVSTGNILRSEIAAGSEFGRLAGTLMAEGKLVPDDVLFGCLKSFLSASNSTSASLLLDGVPRNIAQIETLLKVLGDSDIRLSCTIALNISEEFLLKRFEGRVTCGSCGHVESLSPSSELPLEKCSSCGSVGSLFRRQDDMPHAVKTRLRVFNDATIPCLDELKIKAPVFFVDSSGSVNDVFCNVVSKLKSILPESLVLRQKLS
jgi:adenylate kinase